MARSALIGTLLFLLDQGSKAVLGAQVPHVFNAGFVFGLGEDTFPWLFLGLLGMVILDARARGFRLPETLIIAGGAGNVADRIGRGAVLDWIRFGSLWFNLGDVWISLGTVWIFLSFLRTKRFS